MDRFKVYLTRMIPQEGIDLLRRVADVDINPHDQPVPRDQLLRKMDIGKYDGVMGLLTDTIDGEFFDACPNLRGYANYAVGYDNIDVPEATKRKLPVSNTPGVLTDATAECAWALIFSVARRIVETDTIMRSGTWTGWGPLQFIGGDIKGKTLGIVGAGRIGTEVALMSKGFNMKVIYTSSSGRRNGVLDSELNAKLVSFDDMLAQADFISIHTPLTPKTRHMFDASAFSRMKETAYIVNTARGPVIKEDDLVTALKNGEIAGAGLDVFENEPDLAPGLAELDNAVVLPHIGSATTSSRTDMATLAARNLIAMLKGQKPETCLNPELYD
ncbi:D-glycerate dehydrogenase [Pseudodesulfovibrio sp.]|nr:D-glycerate dehydrogenase [Pseudodesulfovibrio sp.]